MQLLWVFLLSLQCTFGRNALTSIRSLIISKNLAQKLPTSNQFPKRFFQSFQRKATGNLESNNEITLLAKSCKDDDFASDIQKSIKEASQYLSLKSNSWDYLGNEDGISVWRLKKSIGSGDTCNWPCIKSTVTVDMSSDKLFDLLMDSKRIQLINKFSTGRIDVQFIDKNSKIVWNKTKIPYTIKPYDFCSLMHTCNVSSLLCSNSSINKASHLIVSKAVTHPEALESNEFSRSEVLVGVNVLTPCENDPTRTELLSISRVKYGGVPSFLVWSNAFKGTVTYLSGLKVYAKSLLTN